MSTKCITITSEAYERLATFKESTESFSDVINKLTKKSSLLNLVGVLNISEANEVEKYIKETRSRIRKRVEKTADKLK